MKITIDRKNIIDSLYGPQILKVRVNDFLLMKPRNLANFIIENEDITLELINVELVTDITEIFYSTIRAEDYFEPYEWEEVKWTDIVIKQTKKLIFNSDKTDSVFDVLGCFEDIEDYIDEEEYPEDDIHEYYQLVYDMF